jgi:hypothetical protein
MGWFAAGFFAGVAIAIVAEAVEGVSEAIVDENCLFHTNGSGTRLRPVPVVHSNDTTRSREDTTCYCSLCFEKNSRMFMLPVSIQTAL